MMTVREIVVLAIANLTLGHLALFWLAWVAVPIVLGPSAEWLMAGDERTAAEVRADVVDEWDTLCRTSVAVHLVRRVEVALGVFGPAVRLTLWPLWFFQLWFRVEDRGNPGSSPWL